MDAELRTQKIQEVINQENPKGSKRVTYKTDTKDLKAYEIPVEYLVFNQYNGRIGTFVKTYEKQNGPIDATTKEGEELIAGFLWESKKSRNKATLKNIGEIGQTEPGIITKDGVVIDGNRRCMLLKKHAEDNHKSPTYFRAVILDDKLEDNPKEIRKLETIYQMGIDHPVDYNAIEKYLKCKELFEADGFTHEEISKMMGEKPTKIKEYLSILKLMEEYLKVYGYEGMYTRLAEETVEGAFVDVIGYLKKHETGKRVVGRDWEPKKDDIDDLKTIYFDYIRAGFSTHKIRDIGNPSKGKGFFNHRELWRDFCNRYECKIEPINNQEKPLEVLREERPDERIEDIIRSRDYDWKKEVDHPMKENLGKTKRDLDDQNESNTPMELLQRAVNTLKAINKDSDALVGEDIKNISHEIRKLAESFIKIADQKEKDK